MLADAETDVAAGTVGLVEVLVRIDVIISRAVQVGAAADDEGERRRDRLEHLAAGGARAGKLHVGRESRNFFQQLRPAGLEIAGGKQRGLFRIGRAPGLEILRPFLRRA